MSRLESKHQLSEHREYNVLRVGEEFAVDPRSAHMIRTDQNLAISSGLHRGKTPEGRYIVSDSCLLVKYDDHIELIRSPDSKTQIESLMGIDPKKPDAAARIDEAALKTQQETAMALATRLHMPVVIRYLQVAPDVKVHEQTFKA